MKNFLFIFFCIINCLNVYTQSRDFYPETKRISLYPEGIPCKSDFETVVDYNSTGRTFKKIADPEIWYFPAKQINKNKPAILVMPGGGYFDLWFDKEGVDVAKWLNSVGVTAFVLKYRLPHWESENCRSKVALMDAQRAMRIIRSNSKKWSINPSNIGVLGFSAGGHLASTISTHHDQGLPKSSIDMEKNTSSRPDFTVLIYPVVTMQNSPATHFGSRENLIGKITLYAASEKGYNKLMESIRILETLSPSSNTSDFNVESWKENCYNAMNDDFNSPSLIAYLFDAVKYINAVSSGLKKISSEDLESLSKSMKGFFYEVLGLLTPEKDKNENESKQLIGTLELLMTLRDKARADKDFKTSDLIRNSLEKIQIQINDTEEGTSFKVY